ncbi:GDP-mannose 4,6-dehydratase [Dactylosporangium aurantiacum]|uniref:GDP-mannose 4,6-dehydratase n=1 Tax=Dactylosporangium aurantiacum TaxID=35754 RepID=A0A9Q9MNB9_9ACTN|nr:GDP-mannose 4,6-dehydratase [Dactylosporangium aurantiacum]MDG6108624.1 GDP-mannose 4,6-dehydratase [Dactylosporangium aurantiacum]UWZ59156.1 GDP-mannose 4,6-dehydratase [Dactylosporangium aurantiacum]
MRVMITGVTGFAGSYLAEHLVDKPGVEVYGLKRWNSPMTDILPVRDRITLIDFDLGDPHSVYAAVREVRPDRVFHLAAQSYVPMSFRAPVDTIRANALGTVALLEALREVGGDPVIHICTSSEVYGEVPSDELPITEATPFRPQSPYGVSKVAEDLTAYQYFMSYGMHTLRTRSFTHTGPRSKEVFVAPAFAKQIAEIEAGLRPDGIVKVGNLDSTRTFLDIRDMVEAYWLLTERCPAGEVYNIAGDTTCLVGEMLDVLASLTDVTVKAEVDPALLRASDVTRQVPDTTKFREATGWSPRIPFEQTLKDILDYWRAQVSLRALRAER